MSKENQTIPRIPSGTVGPRIPKEFEVTGYFVTIKVFLKNDYYVLVGGVSLTSYEIALNKAMLKAASDYDLEIRNENFPPVEIISKKKVILHENKADVIQEI